MKDAHRKVAKATKEFAEKFFPGYDECPSIHHTGSLEGMANQHNWKPQYCMLVGAHVYNLENYNR